MTVEERVDKLEQKFDELEKNLNNSLLDIKSDLAEIKSCVKNSDNTGDLKNALIEKDVKSLEQRVKKAEEKIKEQDESKKWLVRLVFGSIIGLVLEAVAFYIRTKP